MDKKIVKIMEKIIGNKQKLVPLIFTAKQIGIIEKYLQKKPLKNSEKVQLYSAIKKKVEALQIFESEFCINGNIIYKNIINDNIVNSKITNGNITDNKITMTNRIDEAKKILERFSGKKAFISGSFLYAEKYNDIDVFIISRKRKTETKDNLHITHIRENDLKMAIFQSSLRYSISNFIPKFDTEIKRSVFDDAVIPYQMAINDILDDKEQDNIRDIIFENSLSKKIILDSYSLYEETEKITKMNKEMKIKILGDITKKTLFNIYARSYLYNESRIFIKQLQNTAKEIKANDNQKIFIELFEEIKDECRRAEAKT